MAVREERERAQACHGVGAREKAHFYTIARGNLLESGAAIDLIRARGLTTAVECERARGLCARLGQMLNGLIRAMERRARRCSMVG